MRLRLEFSQIFTMAGLVMSQPGLAVAGPDSPDSTTSSAESSYTIDAAPVSASLPLMAFTFNGDTREAGGVSPGSVVNDGHGNMYLINLDAAEINRQQAAFTWTTSNTVGNVNVTAVGLCKVGASGSCDLAWSKPFFQMVPKGADDDFLVVADAADAATSRETTLWSRSGQIAIHADSSAFQLAYSEELRSYAMFIQINWININNPSASGKSYTPFFAIYSQQDNTRGYASELLRNASTLTSRSQMDEESNLPPDSVISIGPTSPTSTDGGATATAVSGNTGGAAGGESTLSAAQASNSGSSGLATGAIVGIAVGCAAAAIIAAAILLWLCVRRKRRNNAARRASKNDGMDHVHDGYDTTPANHEFVADKETQPRVVESPQSPYLDNIGLGVTAGTAAAAPGGPSSNDRSYTPYGDPPAPIQQHSSLRHSAHVPSPVQSVGPTSAPVAPGHDTGPPRVGSTTPHGLSRSFAALVEEGMTDDEIRRLEEEERALDAAIEQAERNR